MSIGNGLLVCIKPKYTQNGVINRVKILNVGSMVGEQDVDKRLFAIYPGPLVRGVTHKKTVIEFCEERLRTGLMTGPNEVVNKSRANSVTSLCSTVPNSNNTVQSNQFKSSYNLLWNLLILLLRQNGVSQLQKGR